MFDKAYYDYYYYLTLMGSFKIRIWFVGDNFTRDIKLGKLA